MACRDLVIKHYKWRRGGTWSVAGEGVVKLQQQDSGVPSSYLRCGVRMGYIPTASYDVGVQNRSAWACWSRLDGVY